MTRRRKYPWDLAKFASRYPGGYHGYPMPQTLRNLCLALLVVFLLVSSAPARATDDPATFPLSDVKPGMKGVVYTIFEGDKVEKIDLEVIGVLHNAVGPKLDVILVRSARRQSSANGSRRGNERQPRVFRRETGRCAGPQTGNVHARGHRRRDANRRHARDPTYPGGASGLRQRRDFTAHCFARRVCYAHGRGLRSIPGPNRDAAGHVRPVSRDARAIRQGLRLLGHDRDGWRQRGSLARRRQASARRHGWNRFDRGRSFH